MNTVVKHFHGTYKEVRITKIIVPEFSIVVITECPWYKSFFGLKKTRLAISDGVTPIYKLRFI